MKLMNAARALASIQTGNTACVINNKSQNRTRAHTGVNIDLINSLSACVYIYVEFIYIYIY